jgi:Fe-S cluster assembly protein SufD
MSQTMNVALIKPTDHVPTDIFAAARGSLPGSGPVVDVRKDAFDAFAHLGLPSRRVEEWKYTDLRALLREVAPLAAPPDQDALARAAKSVENLAVTDAIKLVLVDGLFIPNLSDLTLADRGVRVHALRDELENADNAARADLLRTIVPQDAMVSLNAAMATDGVVVDITEGTSPDRPIHIVHVATGSGHAAFTRSLLRVGNGVRMTLVESFVAAAGASAYQIHDAVVLWLGEGAEVEHVRLMEDAIDAANISTAIVTIGAKARFNSLNMTTGAAVSRYQTFVKFAGESAEAAAS